MAKRKAKEMKAKAMAAKKRKRTRGNGDESAAVEFLAEEERADVVTTAATIDREERNGVKRPRAGGLYAAVWEALDQMHAAGVAPASKDVRDLAAAKGWNENNALCELSAWRKFNGLSRTHDMKKKLSAKAKLAGLPRMSAEKVIPYTA